MHRDLKPANIMLNKHGVLKIIDFGWARKLDASYFTPMFKQHTPNSVTALYRAPEIHLGQRLYDPKVDIWAAGCIFFELITSQILFNEKNLLSIINKIFNICGFPNEQTWPGVSNMQHF